MEPRYRYFFPSPVTRMKSTPPDDSWWLRLMPRVPQNYDCNANVTNAQKLLVFDQSGDQTTLIFTSILPEASNLHPVEGSKQPLSRDFHALPVAQDVVGENVSSTREDTEEIDALLYSDDDEEDEVNSTGHSPGTAGNFFEEVASSDGYLRKRKVRVDCESSNPRNATVSELEDDAESKCVDQRVGVKRVKRERIRETISILQDIIPGGRSVEPTHVLDAAIEYLKCLKHRAEAMGPSIP